MPEDPNLAGWIEDKDEYKNSNIFGLLFRSISIRHEHEMVYELKSVGKSHDRKSSTPHKVEISRIRSKSGRIYVLAYAKYKQKINANGKYFTVFGVAPHIWKGNIRNSERWLTDIEDKLSDHLERLYGPYGGGELLNGDNALLRNNSESEITCLEETSESCHTRVPHPNSDGSPRVPHSSSDVKSEISDEDNRFPRVPHSSSDVKSPRVPHSSSDKSPRVPHSSSDKSPRVPHSSSDKSPRVPHSSSDKSPRVPHSSSDKSPRVPHSSSDKSPRVPHSSSDKSPRVPHSSSDKSPRVPHSSSDKSPRVPHSSSDKSPRVPHSSSDKSPRVPHSSSDKSPRVPHSSSDVKSEISDEDDNIRIPEPSDIDYSCKEETSEDVSEKLNVSSSVDGQPSTDSGSDKSNYSSKSAIDEELYLINDDPSDFPDIYVNRTSDASKRNRNMEKKKNFKVNASVMKCRRSKSHRIIYGAKGTGKTSFAKSVSQYNCIVIEKFNDLKRYRPSKHKYIIFENIDFSNIDYYVNVGLMMDEDRLIKIENETIFLPKDVLFIFTTRKLSGKVFGNSKEAKGLHRKCYTLLLDEVAFEEEEDSDSEDIFSNTVSGKSKPKRIR